MKRFLFIIFSFIIIFLIGFFVYDNFLLENKILNINKTENNSNSSINSATQNKNKISELNLLFTGDIMLDRNVRKQIESYSNSKDFVNNFLNNLSSVNKNYDYVISNLEGPITENKTKTFNSDGSYTGDLIFTFPTSTAEILNLLNIKVVSLANNHTDNFYKKGFNSTKDFLNKAYIKYFGNPYNDNQEEKLSNIFCEKDICIAFLGYNQFTLNNNFSYFENEMKSLVKQKEENKIDFIVVFAHWGEEYNLSENLEQKNLAHKFIDNGADLIIGAHPHVIQNDEIYKDKYIYYSLGNYIFDQWFSNDVQNGLAVNFIFKKENIDNVFKREIILKEELKVFINKRGGGVEYKK